MYVRDVHIQKNTHMCTCVHIHTHVRTCMCVYTHVRVRVHARPDETCNTHSAGRVYDENVIMLGRPRAHSGKKESL